MDIKTSDEEMVTVCENCLMASCWQGEFMCEYAWSSGTVDMPKGELIELGYEHQDYINRTR